MPRFDWDVANTNHIAEHGVTPEQAEQVVENDPFELPRYFRNGEERQNLLGTTDAGDVLTVVITLRGDLIRIVTAHPANRSMRQRYLRLKEAHHAEDPESPGFQE